MTSAETSLLRLLEQTLDVLEADRDVALGLALGVLATDLGLISGFGYGGSLA
jgi:hypothetical protein